MADLTTTTSNLITSSTSGFTHSLLIIALILLGAIVAAGIITLIVFTMLYSYKVIIHRQDGTSYRKKAKKIRQAGGIYLIRLWRPKKILSQGDLIGKKTYHFYEDNYGELWPYRWQDLKTELEKDPSYSLQPLIKMEKLYTQKNLASLNASGSFWEKYGALVSMTIVAFLFIIGLYLISQQLSKTVASSQASDQLTSEAIQHLVNISTLNYQSSVLLQKIYFKSQSINQTSGLVPAG